MIDNSRSPRLFDPVSRSRNTSTGFAGDNQDAHTAVGKSLRLLCGNLRQPQGIGRRAADHCWMNIVDDRETHGTGHTPARNAMRANLATGFESGPESEKRSEGKGKEDPILSVHLRTTKNRLPAVQNPLPGFLRIEPAQRRAGG